MTQLPRRLDSLKLWHWRALVLLANGYSSQEIARRLGKPQPTIGTLGRRACDVICAPDQRDGREPLAIVRVWATLNLAALHERVREQSAPAWSELPAVVSEARMGVA